MHFVLRTPQDRARCVAFINSQTSPDKPISVTVKPYVKNRSLAQNRLWHAWISEWAKHRGENPKRLKILIKDHLDLYEYETHTKTGEAIAAMRSTSDLTVEEFTGLIQQTEILAAQQGIILERGEDYFEAIGLNTDSPATARQVTSHKDILSHMENARSPAEITEPLQRI